MLLIHSSTMIRALAAAKAQPRHAIEILRFALAADTEAIFFP